ncbi:hypothetical protein LWX53_06000 [bacterium]|nr:hypothetical protein [bacterium]
MKQIDASRGAKNAAPAADDAAAGAAETSAVAGAAAADLARARLLRRIAAALVALSAAATAACVAVTLMSGLLKFDKEAFGFLFGSMRVAALALFTSAAAAFFLDSMYRALGLLQARFARIAALFLLAVGSLLPLAASYAFLRLAAGFRA